MRAGQGISPNVGGDRSEDSLPLEARGLGRPTERLPALDLPVRGDWHLEVETRGTRDAKFRKLVRLRELGLNVDEIYAIGKKYLRESKRTLARLANEIKPGASVDEANEIVKSDHPPRFDGALEYTAKAMADAKRFIAEHDLATLPPNEELNVIETPSYLRHVIPFAAYNAPARFESRKQGFYMVTPVEDKPEMLREPSYAGTRNTAVHEGYPGHHLHL